MVEMTFSLQDLYDNYDAIADGSMAMFNFYIEGLDRNDGGVWDGSAWVSSSYNIIISPAKVKMDDAKKN